MLSWTLASLRHCPLCRLRPAGREGLCLPCGASLRVSVVLPGLLALGYYRSDLRRLVSSFKFAGARVLSRPLAAALATGVLEQAWSPAAVTWVPVHRVRRRQRGYDQARLLAETMASCLGLPCRKLLERKRITRQQSRLDARRRLVNVAGAFSRENAAAIPVGREILLVDDVYTTGATVRACSELLLAAGAGRVRVAAVAIAAPRGRSVPGVGSATGSAESGGDDGPVPATVRGRLSTR